MKNFAPIAITTYIRLEHLKRTIKALQKNILAQQSDVYILSDAPKKGDEQKVADLRKYAHTISGFKKVVIIERKSNSRVFNETEGMRLLLDEYGKMVFLEEDIVTSPYFLHFLNKGLDTYQNNRKIFAICASNEPVRYHAEYHHDVYLSTYFSAWGFATWADRNILDVINYHKGHLDLQKNKKLKAKIKETHPHLINALRQIYEGKLDAADFEIAYFLRKNNLYSLRPIISFVNNIGLDGTGEHCKKTGKFFNDVSMAKKDVIMPESLKYMQELDRESYIYRTGGFNVWQRKINQIKEMLIK